MILKFLSLCQFVCLCVFVMVRNEIASSQAVRGARSSGRNLRALLAAPVARPRERRQVGYFTLRSRFTRKYVTRTSSKAPIQAKQATHNKQKHAQKKACRVSHIVFIYIALRIEMFRMLFF